jgi:hypothetical protein
MARKIWKLKSFFIKEKKRYYISKCGVRGKKGDWNLYVWGSKANDLFKKKGGVKKKIHLSVELFFTISISTSF